MAEFNVPNPVTRQSENQPFASTVSETKAVTGQQIINAPGYYQPKIQYQPAFRNTSAKPAVQAFILKVRDLKLISMVEAR